MSEEIVLYRQFAVIPELDVRLVHSNIFPADIRGGEGIFGDLTVGDDPKRATVRLPAYRISPLGAEFVLDRSGPDYPALNMNPGTPVDLSVRIGSTMCNFFGLVVTTKHKEGAHELLGIRWCQDKESARPEKERRKGSRWICGHEFLPTGIATNPLRFNDFVYIRVLDISNGGMLVATSLRNKLLIPGMYLETMISFPLVGQALVKLKIKSARIRSIGQKDVLAMGCEVISLDPKVLEVIGQYILQFGAQSDVQSLRDEGFTVRSAASALTFSNVKTVDEYRAVLHLRHLAYSAAGKVQNESREEAMGDIFDSRARIIMAKHGDQTVGSVRLMFHSPDDKMEHEQFLDFPQNFPRKDEIVEVTRVCTHPSYRGSDLFFALMKHMVITIVQSKRKWMLGSATPKLIGMYERIGFRGTGLTYRHQDLGNELHEIMFCDIVKVLSGLGIGPSMWNELYSDVLNYLVDLNDVEMDPMMNLRVQSYRMIRPLTKLLSAYVRNPKPKH